MYKVQSDLRARGAAEKMNIGNITKTEIKKLIHRRAEVSHKGDFGKVLIIAGYAGMAGAAILCGSAAVRTGAGLTRFYAPEEIIPILQVSVPEATCIKREEKIANFSDYDAVAIGPGLGKRKENIELIDELMKNYQGTLVIDADGINAIAADGDAEKIKSACCKVILTPHRGEAARLLGCDTDELPDDRFRLAEMLRIKTGATVTVKGAGTVVIDPDGFMLINTTGTPGLAKGGSGDILTGMITALAGQGLTPFEAAASGVFLHGYAGELAEKNYGQYGMAGSDVVMNIGPAIKEIIGV